jgi:hypothetical protein
MRVSRMRDRHIQNMVSFLKKQSNIVVCELVESTLAGNIIAESTGFIDSNYKP